MRKHNTICKTFPERGNFKVAAFNKILEANAEKPIILNESQKEMLKMSEEDIISGRLISQTEIEKEDAKWLN